MIALVLGSADCVDEDVAAALNLFDPDCVIAVNDMIARWHGPIDHAVSLHVEHLPGWLRARATLQSERPTVWSHHGSLLASRQPHLVDRFAPDWKGSSGLFAVTVALELGMRAVLCGVPMDSQPHAPGRSADTWQGPWPQHQVDTYRKAWIANRDRLNASVRSMSGWTAEILGKPDQDWLSA